MGVAPTIKSEFFKPKESEIERPEQIYEVILKYCYYASRPGGVSKIFNSFNVLRRVHLERGQQNTGTPPCVHSHRVWPAAPWSLRRVAFIWEFWLKTNGG
jgi:hypothetical protein